MKIAKTQRGQTLVEVLMTMALAAILLPALATAVVASREGRVQTEEQLYASGLLQETTEALRSIREAGWDAVATNGTYHVSISGTGWTLASGSETVDGYTREVIIENAYRDETGMLLEDDPGGQISTCTPTGNALFEKYDGIGGTAISDLYNDADFPNNPNSSQNISDTVLVTPINIDDNFGGRLSALVCAPEDGDYTFYVNGDDNTELRLSTDTNPANVTTIASVPGWTNAGEWNKYPEQTSTPVTLEGGQYYYIEANYKEGGGGDHAQIGWTMPNSVTQQPISNTNYSLPSETSAVIITNTGLDPSTKKITSTISWATPSSDSISSTFFFSRFENDTWTQTTQADFNAGSHNNTQATNTAGGEVTLDNTTIITWDNPAVVDGYNTAGTTDGRDIFLDAANNRVYLASGANFYVFNSTNPTNVTLMDSIGAGANINGIYVSGNYAFIATASNTQELRAINISNPNNISFAGSINLGDGADATSVFVNGNYAFVGKILSNNGTSREFYVVNISNPNSLSQTGFYNFTSTVYGIHVQDNYAYLSTGSGTGEMIVLDISNPASPSLAGTLNAPGTSLANDVHVDGNYAYLARNTNGGGAEFHVVDISNPGSPAIIGNYETGLDIYAVHVVGARAFISQEQSNEQLSVLNISTPTSPTLIGSANLNNDNANDVMFFGDYAYVASSRNNSELMILTGTPNNSGFETSGTFTSSTFDNGISAGFTYLTLNYTAPLSTDLRVQIATNDDNSTWNYVGPDGTSSTYFTADSPIPFTLSGRYFRYLVELTSVDGVVSPTFENITTTYLP